MKSKNGDFTRGSLLIETCGMRSAVGLRLMLWVIGALFSIILQLDPAAPSPLAIL
jgi:hypothetical protein